MTFNETLYARDDEMDEFGDSGAYGDSLEEDYEEEEEEEEEEAEVAGWGRLAQAAAQTGGEEACEEKASQESRQEEAGEEEACAQGGEEEGREEEACTQGKVSPA